MFWDIFVTMFTSLLKTLGLGDTRLSLELEQKYCLDVYVIDMQYGFLPKGECEVKDTEKLPQKIVSYLDTLCEQVDLLREKGYQITLRFVFSRDYHHPLHTSFKTFENPTGFPAHCQFGTRSSQIEDTIAHWIIANEDKRSIQILFKAFHPCIESFSAVPYGYYSAGDCQGTSKASHDDVKDKPETRRFANGGGVYIKDMSLKDQLKANLFEFNAQETLEYLMKQDVYQPTYPPDTVNVAIVLGLAAAFCPDHTLINIINHQCQNHNHVVDNEKPADNDMAFYVYNLTSGIVLPNKNFAVPLQTMLDNFHDKKICLRSPQFRSSEQLEEDLQLLL